jgi:hypothetical protein
MGFRPPSGYDRRMDDPTSPTPGERKPDDYVESDRDRRIANAVLLVFIVVLVGGGIWLANAMFEQRQLDDCLAQGRRNCTAPIDAPAR